jgi:hypothetical protein
LLVELKRAVVKALERRWSNGISRQLALATQRVVSCQSFPLRDGDPI